MFVTICDNRQLFNIYNAYLLMTEYAALMDIIIT